MSASSNNNRDKGRLAGELYARDTASRDELERLDSFHEEIVTSTPGFGFDDWLRGEVLAPYSHAEYIAIAVIGWDQERDDRREIRDAVETLFEDEDGNLAELFEDEDHEQESPDFLQGFVEGALGVLHEWRSKKAATNLG